MICGTSFRVLSKHFSMSVTGPRNSIWDWVVILNIELRINYLCVHDTIKRDFCVFQIFTLSKYSSVVINTVLECPTFGQYLVGIFDRIAVSRGQSPWMLGGPSKFVRPGGSETSFPALSHKYFCQKRFGKFIVISRLFSSLVFTAGSKCMGGY